MDVCGGGESTNQVVPWSDIVRPFDFTLSELGSHWKVLICFNMIILAVV